MDRLSVRCIPFNGTRAGKRIVFGCDNIGLFEHSGNPIDVMSVSIDAGGFNRSLCNFSGMVSFESILLTEIT